jgi:hypothetical protein
MMPYLDKCNAHNFLRGSFHCARWQRLRIGIYSSLLLLAFPLTAKPTVEMNSHS